MFANMDAMHLSANRSYEVQRANNFEVVFTNLGANTQTLSLAVTSTSIPDDSNGVITLSYQNANVKVAGVHSTGDISLTVKDFITADVEAIIRDWRKEVYDPDTGAIGFAEDYKKSANLYEYSPDGQYVRRWLLTGCWPVSASFGSYSYDSNNTREISMTISCDKATRM